MEGRKSADGSHRTRPCTWPPCSWSSRCICTVPRRGARRNRRWSRSTAWDTRRPRYSPRAPRKTRRSLVSRRTLCKRSRTARGTVPAIVNFVEECLAKRSDGGEERGKREPGCEGVIQLRTERRTVDLFRLVTISKSSEARFTLPLDCRTEFVSRFLSFFLSFFLFFSFLFFFVK